MAIALGIDPGLTGAIAGINSITKAVLIVDMPTKEITGGGMVKRRVDGRELANALRALAGAGDGVPMVTCELVGVMTSRNNAIQTQASLMRTLGAVEAIVDALRWQADYVRPQTWKKFYDLNRDKTGALDMARTLYPGAQESLKRAKDHNRAEALLLAHYGLARNE